MPATAHLVASAGDHGDVGRLIAHRAREIGAGLIAIGAPTGSGVLMAGADALATATFAREAPCDVLVVQWDGQSADGQAATPQVAGQARP